MSHPAKQLALEAYASGLLSPSATRYLERHLASCTVCGNALANVRAYAQLREEARAEQVQVPSWERLEAALSEFGSRADPRASTAPNTPAGPRQIGKLIALAWPLLAVAAALAIAWLGSSDRGVAPSAERGPEAPSGVAVAPRMIVGWVSLLAGSATLEQGTTHSALTLESQLREGDVLSTGPHAQLHVQLGDATGFALASDSRLRIARLRAGEVQLELYAGRVASQVKKLSSSEQYQVWVDTLSASVRGTRFWVERSVAAGAAAGAPNQVLLARGTARFDVAVFVHEGRVDIAQNGELLAQLAPGQGYPVEARGSAREQNKERFAAERARNRESVHLTLPDVKATVGLILPPLPALRAFIVDGAAVSAAGTLAMRLPRGPSELRGEDLRGQIRSVQVDLTAPLTRLEPDALNELLAPKSAPVGYLSAEEISKVMRAGIEPLRRCYERNLRFLPELEGKPTLRMRVSAEGRVVRAELEARTKLPIDLERCIEIEMQKLVFPKPEGGGPLTFEVPLKLKSSN